MLGVTVVGGRNYGDEGVRVPWRQGPNRRPSPSRPPALHTSATSAGGATHRRARWRGPCAPPATPLAATSGGHHDAPRARHPDFLGGLASVRPPPRRPIPPTPTPTPVSVRGAFVGGAKRTRRRGGHRYRRRAAAVRMAAFLPPRPLCDRSAAVVLVWGGGIGGEEPSKRRNETGGAGGLPAVATAVHAACKSASRPRCATH